MMKRSGEEMADHQSGSDSVLGGQFVYQILYWALFMSSPVVGDKPNKGAHAGSEDLCGRK